MKKFINWIKSPASDFVLLVIALVLACLVGQRAFLRADITAPRTYSLSPASVQVVRTLEDPLSVRVFFTDRSQLPGQVNSVYQYVEDLLKEYKGAANKNFSYKFMDMDKPENVALAQSYNLRQVQIQDVKANEVGFKQVWLGIVITCNDSIETIDGITSADGFEYKLTTKISRMIATTNTLAGLDGKVHLTLYSTAKLSEFGINGFDQIEKKVQSAYDNVNRKNMDRIEYAKIDPATSDIPALVEKYGLQNISYKGKDGSNGTAVIGLVLEYGDKFRLIPLQMQRMIFGGYTMVGLDNLEDSISDSLQSLVSKTQQIGYITGNGEAELSDQQGNPSQFSSLLEDMYELKPVSLADEDIPAGLTSIIINGPKSSFTEAELYKIDQFLMRGGNVMLFLDPYDEVQSQNQNPYYQQPPSYQPIKTGLEKLLAKYGISAGTNYVLDKHCAEVSQQQYGKLELYWAPTVQKNGLAKRSVITKNLGYVIFLQTGSIDIADNETGLKNKDRTFTPLAKSSSESWLLSRNIVLNPMYLQPPEDKSTEKAENLAVLVEGKFNSAFDAAPEGSDTVTSDSDKTAAKRAETNESLSGSTYLAKSTLPGKLFVAGTSKITGDQSYGDQYSTEPIAIFVRNAVDYMNGEQDMCTMRTKGLSLNTLTITSGFWATKAGSVMLLLIQYFNEFILAVLVGLSGLIVLLCRQSRRRRIHEHYNPNDEREISRKAKGSTK